MYPPRTAPRLPYSNGRRTDLNRSGSDQRVPVLVVCYVLCEPKAMAPEKSKNAIETRIPSLGRAFLRDSGSIFLSDGRDEIDNQRVDLSQVFPSALFRFQLTIAKDDRQIADLVQHSARDVFDRTACPENGETNKQIIFKPGDVCPGGRSQIVVQRVKFGFKHRNRRRLPLSSTTSLFAFRLRFHAAEPIRLRCVGPVGPTLRPSGQTTIRPPGNCFPGGLALT